MKKGNVANGGLYAEELHLPTVHFENKNNLKYLHNLVANPQNLKFIGITGFASGLLIQPFCISLVTASQNFITL